MIFKIKKTDGRMNGHQYFKYMANISYFSDDIINLRLWLENTYGKSVELDLWEKYPEHRCENWSWERTETKSAYRCRIYLKSDQELSWFLLAWS